MKQDIYQTKINSIKAGIEQLRELAQTARARIKSYQPYEVSKVYSVLLTSSPKWSYTLS